MKFQNSSPMDANWMEEGDLADSPNVSQLYLDAFGLEPTLEQVPTGSA